MNQLVNGSHFRHEEGYFEWWYFHFASANGFAANIVLHETDIFGLNKSPYVSMSYQLPPHEPKYLRMTIPDESIVRGSEFLYQSEGFFEESDSGIEIRLIFPSDEVFEVAISKLTEPLILNNCILYQDGDKRSYWRLQVPFGHFSSSLSSAVFFAIQTQKGELIERYAVVSPSGTQGSVVHGQVPHLAELAKSDNPELWFGEPVVTFPFGTTLRTRIDPNSLLRSRVSEAHGDFATTYLRWAGDAIVSPPNSFHYGITEYIRIRKED